MRYCSLFPDYINYDCLIGSVVKTIEVNLITFIIEFNPFGSTVIFVHEKMAFIVSGDAAVDKIAFAVILDGMEAQVSIDRKSVV